MFDFLILLGLVGSQFVLVPNLASGDELWVAYWLILVAVSSFHFKAHRHVNMLWAIPFMLAVFSSVLSNMNSPIYSIYAHVFTRVLIGAIAVKVIAERMTLTAKQIGWVVLRLWLITYAVLIAQSLGYGWKGYELSGFYTMPWIMGSVAVLSIPFLRKLKAWYSLILIIPLILSHSSACVAVALVMWFQPKLQLRTLLLVILGMLGYVYFFDQGVDRARFAVIYNSIPYIHNWWMGDGIGSWAHRAFVKMNGADMYYWRWAHNEIYQICTELGVVGVSCFGALLVDLFGKADRTTRYYLGGIVALACVHPIWHMPRLIGFSLLLIAMILRSDSEDTSFG